MYKLIFQAGNDGSDRMLPGVIGLAGHASTVQRGHEEIGRQ